MARTHASIKNDVQYKALLALLGDEDKALESFQRLTATVAEPKVDPAMQTLIDAGFTPEQIAAAMSDDTPPVAEPEVVVEPHEELREQQGFDFAKGRVYAGAELAEAIVTVTKTGKPRIVTGRTVNERTKAVLVYRLESGDVALQNLIKSVA